jgi:SAM-dependent methyltransferase
MSSELDPALVAYARSLGSSADESKPSVFWQRQLEVEQASRARDELSLSELDAFLQSGRYGFDELPDAVDDPRDDPAVQKALEGVAAARAVARKLIPAGFGLDGDEWEHLRSLDFLDRAGLLADYLDFIAPLRVRSSMSTARHWYYARQLCELTADLPSRLDVLEIGAGAGNLAFFLERMGRVRSYTIVDLPQMLVRAAYELGRRLPDAALAFDEVRGEAGRWSFVSDFRAGELIPGAAFDLALNVNSFMEMDRGTRDGYIDLIYRTARPRALFFNVNRRQHALPLADGGTWDSNPLLYPYRANDEVLIWEEDPFQTLTRGKWGARTTLAFTRAARIGGAG